MLRPQVLVIVIFVLINVGVRCHIPLELRKDFFNIYKGLAVEVKEITGTHVTLEKVKFILFNKNHLEDGIAITSENLSLVQPTKDKVIFILHGWTSSGDAEWVLDMKNAFLTRYSESSVIIVDWKNPATQPYSIASINTYDVGNFLADKIIDLVDKYNISIKQFLLVGHSLGGQACGFAGKRLKSIGKKLPRIIGLDPAGPLFTVRPKEKRLNREDADVVEVIHSDGDTFGFRGPCGSIDFFPNGGKSQPGCKRIDLLDIMAITDPVVCDHQRSYQYFTEAILNPTDFIATYCMEYGLFKTRCDENITVPMGDLTTTLTGKFYLETNKEPPYAKKSSSQGGLFNKFSALIKH